MFLMHFARERHKSKDEILATYSSRELTLWQIYHDYFPFDFGWNQTALLADVMCRLQPGTKYHGKPADWIPAKQIKSHETINSKMVLHNFKRAAAAMKQNEVLRKKPIKPTT